MQNNASTHTRYRILSVAVLAIAAVFVVRLFYLQVMQHEHYQMLANEEQMRRWKLPAERGEIYALDGDTPVKLVMNETVYTVWADPKEVKEPDAIVDTLRKVAGGELVANARELLDKKETRYQVLAKNVTYKQAKLIKAEKYYAVGFERNTLRAYPEGQLASQVLGFVNGDHKGQYGVESALNDDLTGTDGLIRTVADVRDVPLTIGNDNINIPAVHGKNVVLTIDRNVQRKAEQALAAGVKRSGAESASAIVMNPNNGQVIAMANVPTYNPEKLSKVKDLSLLNNNTISYPFEPGSVMKLFAFGSAIDSGAITPKDTFYNSDYVQIYDAKIGNATKGLTGTRTYQFALNMSLNTGSVAALQEMGGGDITKSARDTLYDYFSNRFRLNAKTGVELSGEVPGTIISPDEVQGNAVRYANMTFGQGLTVTPIEAVASFSALVNGGTYYQPTVVAGEVNAENAYVTRDSKVVKSNVVSAATSSTMRAMAHEAHYAAYKPKNDGSDKYYVGGKTGTSQAIDPATGKYTFDVTTGAYLGFGGEKDADNLSYVIMIRVAGNGTFNGGVDAKQIFNTISNWMLNYLKLEPKG